MELELRTATASAAGVADVGRSRVRPCSSGCWYCRCRSVRSLDGAIRTLVPMRSRFRVGLVRVTRSCCGRNAGNVWKLTCQNSVPARSCTRISTRRPRNPAGSCRHSGVQLQVLPRVRNQHPKNQNGPKSPLQKGPNSPRRTECSACNVLRCTSRICYLCCRYLNCKSDCTASTLRVPARSMRSGQRRCSHVRSGACTARTAVGDLRVSGNWLVGASTVALACCPGAGA